MHLYAETGLQNHHHTCMYLMLKYICAIILMNR